MRLAGKTAIVTGGGSGIGRNASIRMALEGAAVLAVDIDYPTLVQTKGMAEEKGLHMEILRCDVSSEEDVKKTLAVAVELWSGVDILVNIAGIQVTKSLGQTTLDDFNRMMGINMGGVFLFTREALLLMEKAGKGSIVNLASELALVGYPGLAVYTATKGAMVSFTRSAALEAIPYGVRVNCICPGATDTPIFWEGETDPEKKKQILEQVQVEKPCGRLITTDEVANGIIFLASDEASAVVGASLVMDGGFTAQ